MTEKRLTCPICQYTFDPDEHVGCGICPLHKRCLMICCPSCGYSIALQEKSTLAKWTSILMKGR
jgi:hypothetical protein